MRKLKQITANFKDSRSQIVWNWPLLRGLTGERLQLHEELSLQEGAPRETRIEGTREVEEFEETI